MTKHIISFGALVFTLHFFTYSSIAQTNLNNLNAYGELGTFDSSDNFDLKRKKTGLIHNGLGLLSLEHSKRVLPINANIQANQIELFSSTPNEFILAKLGDLVDDSEIGRLTIFDQGVFKVDITSIGSAGSINTIGQNDSNNTLASWPSGNPDVGYVAVQDVNSQIQAGMFVDGNGDGIVFGDSKNFRMDHPTEPGKEIWYASLEGPEAAAYERGVGQLSNGTVFIEYSEHFKLVINPETVTVNLTPHYADTYGLAVVEKTSEGFVVKELKNRKGNFSFDWEVKAVRSGYEDYRVIRDASEVEPGGIHPDK